MSAIIEAEHLTRVFNGKLRAVNDVSFAVAHGETFGFLGPNGAGKTTTVSMLTANLAPTEGRAIVDGVDVARHPARVKQRIGLVFQESSSDGELTGRENLALAAGLFAVPRALARDRIEQLLDRMQLSDAADRLVKTYSGGMRRRLELAVGIVHTPRVLFLDEPTLGLDPQGRAGFWEYVKELQQRDELTVFVTTHYLDEADQLCDRIAIIDHGTIVALGTPSQLKDRVGGDVVTLKPAGPGPDLTAALARLPGVVGVQLQDGAYRLKSPAGETIVPAAVQVASDGGVRLAAVSLKRPSLDEVFLEFTGREFREDEGPTATDWAVRARQFQQARRR
jgi:ABC-2 type transport system ATP-binding protein